MTNEELIIAVKSGIRVQENMYLLYTQNLTLLKLWSIKYIEIIGAEDVLQECYIALYKAVQGFDVSKGYKFTTYLQKCVVWHFKQISSNQNGIKINYANKKLLAKYNSLCERWLQEQNKKPSLEEAADLLQCSINDIEEILRYLQLRNCESIDKPISNGSSDDLNVAEVLSDNTNIQNDFEQQDTQKQLKHIWHYVHQVCRENEEKVLQQVYIENLTYTAIGAINGYTAERARQIERNALKRLRNNEAFNTWLEALGFRYNLIKPEISMRYGFSAWSNNNASSVELWLEAKERFQRYMLEQEQSAEGKQWADMIAAAFSV